MSKAFELFAPDGQIACREMQAFADHLNAKTDLREGPDCQEFFERHRHVAAWLGGYASTFFKPDRLAFRLKLFDDFAYDIAIADTRRRRYCFVELENADQGSIFNAKVRRFRPPWGAVWRGQSVR